MNRSPALSPPSRLFCATRTGGRHAKVDHAVKDGPAVFSSIF
jgi:hypothetical protein